MSDLPPAPADDAVATPDAVGAALRAAREAAGLSIDAVSQQLKLAPRQIRAIEDGDYAGLPGRTFVRGFVRNYARLLQLDPDAVVAALPDAAAAPLGATARAIGELPATREKRGAGWSRWAIPLALVALIGIAAVYEFTRPPGLRRVAEPRSVLPKAATGDPIATPAGVGTPLPNPLLAGDVAPATIAGTPEAPKDNAAVDGEATAAAPTATGANLPDSPRSAPQPAGAPGDATLAIAYRSAAWTEVRDRNGRMLLSNTGVPGTTQTVSGAPPFDIVLGNAFETTLTWRGAVVDLAPYMKQNVARVRLH